jgi:serine/threonine-protein kinase
MLEETPLSPSGANRMNGVRLGPWVIDEKLGSGGMGTVWLARRAGAVPGEPQVAAVKVLAPELAMDPGFIERFRREIDILRRLDHPHIVRFLESAAGGEHTWFAMEYVDGTSLEAVLALRRRLPWDEVLDLAVQIAPALKHAHDRGVIHRDLKPSNLLFGPDGVKLSDFGIASLFASRHLTVTGGVVGTAEYLSPEQAAGKPVTPRSDLYSLGVVLYTLLTGRNPFEGEVVDLLHKHRFAQFEQPSRLVPDLPGDFEEVICQLLDKDPGRRPADAGVLARRLGVLRRRMEFKSAQAQTETTKLDLRQASAGEGPATLMSKLMRAELERMNRGGPVKQFFNRPWVIVTLFALCVSTLVWAFWPASAEGLFRRGEALMMSEDPDDWANGWDRYLKRLAEDFPDYHREEVAQFRKKYDSYTAARQTAIKVRQAGPMTEPQWFYQEGLRRQQLGDEAGARRSWQNLVDAFREVPTEQPWVRLAEKQLAGGLDEKGPARQWQPVRDAVKKARDLREEGKAKEAEAILHGLRELYRDEPAALRIIKGD